MDDRDLLTLEGCEIHPPTRLAKVKLSVGAIVVGASASCMLWWLSPSLLGAGIIAVLMLLAALAGIATLWSP